MGRKTKQPIFNMYSETYPPQKGIYEKYRRALVQRLSDEGKVVYYSSVTPVPTNFRLDPPFGPDNLWVRQWHSISLDGPLKDTIKELAGYLESAPDATIEDQTYYEYGDAYHRVVVSWYRQADEFELALYNELEEAANQQGALAKQAQLDQARKLLREAGEI